MFNIFKLNSFLLPFPLIYVYHVYPTLLVICEPKTTCFSYHLIAWSDSTNKNTRNGQWQQTWTMFQALASWCLKYGCTLCILWKFQLNLTKLNSRPCMTSTVHTSHAGPWQNLSAMAWNLPSKLVSMHVCIYIYYNILYLYIYIYICNIYAKYIYLYIHMHTQHHFWIIWDNASHVLPNYAVLFSKPCLRIQRCRSRRIPKGHPSWALVKNWRKLVDMEPSKLRC